jgi:DNA polymerase-3 subunit beta
MFKTQVEPFREQLKRCSYAVERSVPQPILANFLISLEGSKLTVAGSSGDLYITDTCDVVLDPNATDQSLAVNAEKLMATVRHAAPLDNVSLALDGSLLKVHSGNADYSVSTIPANEFPHPDEENVKLLTEITVPENEMQRLVHNVSFAMAEGNHRYYLNGMLWSFDEDGIVGVSTNGHRMARDSIKVTVESEAREVIVPRATINHLQSLLSTSDRDVRIKLFGGSGDSGNKPPHDASRVRVSFGSTVLVNQLINAKYPDHERVIPKAHDNVVVVDRTALRDALRRVGCFADPKDYVVKINFGDSTLTLVCENKESKATDVIELVKHDGSPVELNFSGPYLEQVLNTLEQNEIVISLKDATSSVLIVPSGENPTFKYVVMPVRS